MGGNETEFPVGLPNSGTEDESTAAYGTLGENLDLGSLGPSSTPLPHIVVEHSCSDWAGELLLGPEELCSTLMRRGGAPMGKWRVLLLLCAKAVRVEPSTGVAFEEAVPLCVLGLGVGGLLAQAALAVLPARYVGKPGACVPGGQGAAGHCEKTRYAGSEPGA